MSFDAHLLEESAEELFEDAPCGYLSTQLDGTIIKVNRTLERWIGRSRDELLGLVRFRDLLTPGARIYHDTHLAPLLQMQGTVGEIALDLVCADETRLPVLMNSALRRDSAGQPQVIRITVFDATDRQRYEQELRRVSEREHEIALALQRSLLSGDLPASRVVQVAVSYRAAARGLEIGGDWYDSFWLDHPHTIALVIGDVVGRGLHAAATMGQLRSAVRAFASLHRSPRQVLEALDDYSRRHAVGALTTMIYAELNVDSGQLRYACAGHPPPLIIEPDREPRLAWQARSLPINAYDEPRPRPEASETLPRGTAVLLYTDGLVEHHLRPIDNGMNDLALAAARGHELPIEGMVRGCVDAMASADTVDDRCLLAARLHKLTPASI